MFVDPRMLGSGCCLACRSTGQNASPLGHCREASNNTGCPFCGYDTRQWQALPSNKDGFGSTGSQQSLPKRQWPFSTLFSKVRPHDSVSIKAVRLSPLVPPHPDLSLGTLPSVPNLYPSRIQAGPHYPRRTSFSRSHLYQSIPARTRLFFLFLPPIIHHL